MSKVGQYPANKRGKRTEQVAELLRQEINNILIKDFEPPPGSLISVSVVTVSPDLKNATAYLSIIPSHKLGSSLEIIKKFSPHLQKKLNQKIVLRVVPKISWAIDNRDIKYSEIEKALQ